MAATRGWQTDALTTAKAQHERYDDTRLQHLPLGTRVFNLDLASGGVIDLPLGAVRAFKRLTTAVSGGNGKPAAAGDSPPSEVPVVSDVIRRVRGFRDFEMWRRWAIAGARLARRIAEPHRVMAVLSSGPPHMAHEAARRVAATLQRPLIIDFRDPWVIDSATGQSTVTERRIRVYEERVCRAADLVVLNTEATLDAFATRYPDLRGKMMTVMNGADPEVKAFTSTRDPKFTLAQTGDLYEGRDPRPFFRGVARFLETCPDARRDLRVRFVGAKGYMGTSLGAIAQGEGLTDVFEHSGPVTRKEALTLSGSAAINVLLQQDATNSIPSKVYDYVQFPSTILALCHQVDATRRLLEGSSAVVVSPEDVDGIARAIEATYQSWRGGSRPQPLNEDGRFDRSRHVTRLLDAVERIAVNHD